MNSSKFKELKNYKKEKINNIRSEGHKRIISIYDTPIQLIRKEDGEILKPFYSNCYGKVYFFDESDNLIFLKDKALEKYKISEYKGE